jgi:signal transduction histidine kinase/FixJ family two-component response regulator
VFVVPEIIKQFFDKAPGLIFIIDGNSFIKAINAEGCAELGFQVSELLETSLLLRADSQNSVTTEMWKQIVECSTDFRIQFHHKNSTLKIYHFTSREIIFENEKHFIVQGVDYTEFEKSRKDIEIAEKLYDLNLNRLHKTLTELKKAKAAVEENANIKQMFLANVSHEIRTPMNAIIGFSNVLLKDNLNAEQMQFVQAIKNSGDNLLRIINEILDFSKLESGTFTFDESEFNLIDVLNSVRELFELKLNEKGLLFEMKLDSSVPQNVVGDSSRLYQILVNLLGNAIKFTSKGKVQILVSLAKDSSVESKIRFNVIDSGIGISEENLNKIFESFTQATNDTTRKYGGTGLGLAICKQLVELQNGNIYVESNLGEGSSFIFEIPFKKVALNVNNVLLIPTQHYEIERLDKYKILLVEDNEINTLLATKILQDWGFKYSIACSGLEALSKLNQEYFDLVLMDIQMPEMDGYEATKIIRTTNTKYQNIPIIAATAHAGSDEEARVLKVGMNDYVSKPFALDILLGKMLALLKQTIIYSETTKEESSNVHSVTNLEYLTRVAGGDKVFVDKMINLYLEKCDEAVISIKSAMNNGNWIDFKAQVHRFLPSLAFMGIDKITNDLYLINDLKIEPKSLIQFEPTIIALEILVGKSKLELVNYLSQHSDLK